MGLGRIRTIKPELFLDEHLARLGELHQLVFIGLLPQADREGRLEDRPDRLRALIRPYHPKTRMDTILTDLTTAGFLIRYEVDRNHFIQICGFTKHQRPNSREPDSSIPPPPADVARVRARADVRGHTAAAVEGKGRERKGTGTGTEREPSTRLTTRADAPEVVPLVGFEAFWTAYPKKTHRQDAERAWQKLAPDDALARQIVAAVRVHAEHPAWRDTKYVPNPATYLNGRRWDDELPAARKTAIDLDPYREFAAKGGG